MRVSERGESVKHITEASLQSRLAETLDQVTEDCEAIVVTRSGKNAVVLVPQAEYASLVETAWLLSTPANARRLLQSVDQLNARRDIG
ncbi:type II toxin-antitoxin system Phd/YefM family antitoxin [Arthrobacter ginkgonis]